MNMILLLYCVTLAGLIFYIYCWFNKPESPILFYLPLCITCLFLIIILFEEVRFNKELGFINACIWGFITGVNFKRGLK